METSAITIRSDGLLDRIVTDVTVQQSEQYCKRQGLKLKAANARALWDTGATGCCISKNLAEYLGLICVDSWNLTSVHNSTTANVYAVDIILPDNIAIANVPVVELTASGYYDLIIGMNIIRLGDFALTNDNGKTIFSFRLPTGNRPVDFSVQE